MIRIGRCGVLLAVMGLAWPARGEAPATAPVPVPGRPSLQRGAFPVLGAGYSIPQRAYASAGLIIGDYGGCMGMGGGFLLQVQPGRDGGRLAVGYAMSDAAPLPFFGAAAKTTFTRTWNRPWNTSAGTTYAGGEIALTLAYVHVAAGHEWRLSGPGRSHMTSLALGFGF